MDPNSIRAGLCLPLALLFFILSFINIRVCAQGVTSDPQVVPITGRSNANALKGSTFVPQFSTTQLSGINQVNVCDTWTFQLKIGNNGSIEKVADMTQLPGREYILVGTTDAGSGERGLIIKMDKESNIIWSKTISLPGSNLSIKKIKHFSNGSIYVLSDAKDIVSNETTPVLSEFDTNGNLLWAQKLVVQGMAGSWRGIDFEEWKENSFSIVISNNLHFNVSRLSTQTRATIWSKTFASRGALNVTGIGNEFFDTYVVYNDTESGFRKGVVAQFDFSTGNLRASSSIGGIDGNDYFFQSFRMINLRPRVTGYQHKNGRYDLIKVNYNPLSEPGLKEIFSINGIAFSNQLSTSQNEWTEILGFTNGPNTKELYLTSTYPDNYSTQIRASKVSVLDDIDLKNIIRTHDGGMLAGSNTVGPNGDILLTKADSIATLPGCSSVPVPASFTAAGFQYTSVSIPALSNTIALTPTSVVNQNFVLQVHTECKTLSCPTVAEPDTCLRTFFKEYRTNSQSTMLSHGLKASENRILAIGGTRQNPYVAEDLSHFFLFDTLGKLIDSRVLRSDIRTGFNKLRKLRDGNMVGVGYVYYGYDSLEAFIMKFDEHFNVFWKKRMVTNPRVGGFADFIESDEGDLYCYTTDRRTTSLEKRILIKLDSNGDPVWFRRYDAGQNIFLGNAERNPKLVEAGNHIYLKYEEEMTDNSPHLIKINKGDGSVVWVKKIVIPQASNYNLLNLLTDKKNLYFFGSMGSFFTLIKISPDGNLLNSKNISNPNLYMSRADQKTDTNFIISLNRLNYPFNTYGVVEIDTAFNTRRSQFMQMPKPGAIYGTIPFSDSVTYAIGNFFYNNVYHATFSLQKYNFNSSFGRCEVTEVPLDLKNYPVSVINKTTIVENLAVPVVQGVNAVFESFHAGYSSSYCGNTPCTSIKLTGPGTICDSTEIYDFKLSKNAGCTSLTNWIMGTTPNQVKVISISDSLLRIKVTASGNFKIYSKIFANCDWIEDSLTVNASFSSLRLDLGPDTAICSGNTVILNAGRGFSSYKWQDGSGDSLLTVTVPGVYFVETTGGCGGTLRDTVRVGLAGSVSINVGPDRVKCNSDTLKIMAPPGFIKYNWTPNYNLEIASSREVIINPQHDTVYYLKAERSPNCFAFDTVYVKVNHSPSIDLGFDQSFCEGDSVLFDAGNQFISYQWNTGAHGQKIAAATAGIYSIRAIDANGCVSNDTVRVLTTFKNPIVALDSSPVICEGTIRSLDAGAGFNSYLWSDGTTQRSKTVSMPGTYAVTVISRDGCKASDTVHITSILPPPASFLPADTILCRYGKIDLHPAKDFKTYSWNNNVMAKTITVSKSGLYWLEVTDSSGCKGRDTIIVNPKDCLNGFFIPSAFTPDNNGKNDEFKPLLFGNVQSYEFTIFNRWGQIVFQTTDFQKGWDGQLGGKFADTGTFVWVCKYQLEGEAPKMTKGTVMLIR